MTAAASQHDDEPPADSAEEPMSEVAFAVIQRAHAICDHAPARELPAGPHDRFSRRLENWNLDEQRAEQALIPHATRILRAQIRAVVLVREMKERGERCDVEDFIGGFQIPKIWEFELGDDETDEPSVDWAQLAADAWCGEGWKVAALDYHRTRRGVRP
jgi:hypothetical protein